MPVKDFEGLEIWKEARRLTCEIYDLSKTTNVFERLWLTKSNATRSSFNYVEHRRRI